MGQPHPSTPEQRAQWTASMLADRGEYGAVTQLSRQSGVSRPTLYAWREQAERALLLTFTPPAPPSPLYPDLERQVLTLWIAHSSDRDIQTCFAALTQQGIGVGRITVILAEAEQRALDYLATHMPPSSRAVALDEIYANDRHGAYLTIADVHSGAIWACVGPLSADTDSWTLLVWEAQDHGLVVDRAVMDGGAAARAACQRVRRAIAIQGDQWHVLHRCAQLQGRLDRTWRERRDRTVVVARQAARVAATQKPKGRKMQTDLAAHTTQVAAARRVADAVRYLRQELRRLLSVVVLDHRGVLNAQQRQADLEALLDLLSEVADGADAPQRGVVRQVHALVTFTLPSLLTFVPRLDHLYADLRPLLGPSAQAQVAWAWLHRRALGWRRAAMVAALPEAWRAGARVLLAAWEDAVGVSTAVERWHSILRVHLSVHRTLSPGKLALLVVWHNHRVRMSRCPQRAEPAPVEWDGPGAHRLAGRVRLGARYGRWRAGACHSGGGAGSVTSKL